jgi:hypothetical protein
LVSEFIALTELSYVAEGAGEEDEEEEEEEEEEEAEDEEDEEDEEEKEGPTPTSMYEHLANVFELLEG